MLLIMYGFPKIHKTPNSARFIAASKNCSTKLLSDALHKNFKIIFDTVGSFNYKSFFYLGCKKF